MERLDAARIALDRSDTAGARGQERPGETAGAGPDLDRVDAVERPRGAGDAPRQIEVEDEILAEAPARGDAVSGDDLAQRRRRGGRYLAQ
jgi:hypothetical protein